MDNERHALDEKKSSGTHSNQCIMPTQYQCASCNGIFDKGWSDEEAMTEREDNGWTDIDCELVCDDCYKKIISIANGIYNAGGR